VNVVVALDGRFVLNEGRPASIHMHYDSLWVRYLEVFDTVTVVGRLFAEEHPKAKPIEGPGVTFVPLPGYYGPLGYLTKATQIARKVQTLIQPESAFILRPPSMVGNLFGRALRRTGHPYGVEVVGDPYDSFSPGAVRHPLRAFFRFWLPRQLRAQCHGACAALYVTSGALQQRYPASPDAYSVGCSDVDLPAPAFVDAPRVFPRPPKPVTLVMVGNLSQLYKAPDVLIDALARNQAEGLDWRLRLIGDGRYRAALEQRAKQLGVGDRVQFLGQLTAGEAVREHLDQADLFVLPSRQEGLPRAMAEAMARALPCIGSSVGGIPELLAPEEYQAETLKARRQTFYQEVRTRTEAWIGANGHNPPVPR